MTLSGDYLFIGLILLGVFLTWFCTIRRNILLAFSSSLVWFGCAAWLFFGTSVLGLDETWKQIIVWAFVMMIFVPWLLFADIEVKHQRTTKFGSSSWSSYSGDTPSFEDQMSTADKYKIELRERLDRARRLGSGRRRY